VGDELSSNARLIAQTDERCTCDYANEEVPAQKQKPNQREALYRSRTSSEWLFKRGTRGEPLQFSASFGRLLTGQNRGRGRRGFVSIVMADPMTPFVTFPSREVWPQRGAKSAKRNGTAAKRWGQENVRWPTRDREQQRCSAHQRERGVSATTAGVRCEVRLKTGSRNLNVAS